MILRPYQQLAVSAIMADIKGGVNPLVHMSTGCLTGDTIIYLNRGGKCRKYTLEHAYNSYNNIKKNPKSKFFNREIFSYTRSFLKEDNRIGLNKVIDVVFSGEKEVWELLLEDGKILKLTKDHKVMTSEGFVEAKELKLNSLVMVDDNYIAKSSGVKHKKICDLNVRVSNHPYARNINTKKYPFKSIEKHRAIYEAHINNLSLNLYLELVQDKKSDLTGMVFINPLIYDIHHVDFNHYNNDPKNLTHLTKQEHQKIHGKINSKNFNQGVPTFIKVKSTKYVGVEKTYDVCCESPNNNFNANGIIVHNSGKTEVFFEVCKRFLADRPCAPVCILLNRVLLLDQTIRRIEKIFPRELIGVVCGTRNKRVYASITVATIGSVQKDKKFGLVIADEAHRVTLNNKDTAYMRFLGAQPLVMGVTATPWRHDGYIYSKDSPLWKKLTYTKPLTEMINEGYLVKPIIRKSNEEYDLSGLRIVLGDYAQDELANRVEDKNKIAKQVTDALDKAQDRKHIVWVCVSIKHSEMIMEELQSRGESCAIVHSLLTNTQIEAFKNSFENGHSRHIVSVSMLCEGLDIPCIDCIVMMRPTKSSSLWVQVAGRALRLAPNKENALILDYGRVAENCGALDQPIVRGKGKGNILQASPPMKFCPGCLSYIAASARECPDCSMVFPKPEPTKNLTDRAADTDILSTPVPPKTIDVSSIVAINMHQGKKARCAKITFYPKNLFSRDIYDFSFHFNVWKKFTRIGIKDVRTLEDAEKYNNIKWDSGIQKIVVDYSGSYPEIVDVIK